MDIAVLRRADFTDAHYAEISQFIATRNSDRAQHVGYLGENPADVADELHEIAGDFAFGMVRDGGELAGALGAEWDTDIGRAWLLGPWAGTPQLMDELYAVVDAAIPAIVGEREIFCDVSNAALAAFAARHGFGPPGEHAIFVFPRARLAGLPPVTLPTLTPEHADQFAALHDRAFPGTHSPAAALLAKEQPVWVVVDGGTLLGYVTLKMRSDFDDAQIDYVAVDESARGRGVGARLVTAALHLAFADERVTHMKLVTGNPVARRLYERVGFDLDQEMRSFRASGSSAELELRGTRATPAGSLSCAQAY
jgi:ribosomal protein S18 acetylase RimI-like enzyme